MAHRCRQFIVLATTVALFVQCMVASSAACSCGFNVPVSEQTHCCEAKAKPESKSCCHSSQCACSHDCKTSEQACDCRCDSRRSQELPKEEREEPTRSPGFTFVKSECRLLQLPKSTGQNRRVAELRPTRLTCAQILLCTWQT